MATGDDDEQSPDAERLISEREAAARQTRRRIAKFTAIGCLIATAIFGAAEVATTDDEDPPATDSSAVGAAEDFALPAQQTDNLAAAVKAAGCKLAAFRSEGAEHVPETASVTYKTNPPTSGDHFQVPGQDGVYLPGNPPQTGNWVHSLEHGRVLFQYRKGTPQDRIGQLETLFNEPYSSGGPGYHTLLLENTTRMPFAVAAVAWTRYMACETFSDRTFDALRAFRADAVDKAPEQVP